MAITSCMIIFYTLVAISSIVATNGSAVDDVCCQTKNPDCCVEALGGPGSENSDLPGLGLAGLETGVSGALKCQRKFQKLLVLSPRTDLIPLFSQCEKLYQDAYETIFAARQAARQFGRWDQVDPNVVPVLGDVDQCEDLFTGSSPVKLLGDRVRVAAEAVAVVARIITRGS